MDKVIIGIPRGLYFYYFHYFWKSFFKYLNIDIVISPPTNKEIISNGSKLAPDEMCLSMKIFLGHVNYLKDKCDYILIPRIDNYGLKEQTCTNFLAIYDIVNNLFNKKIINYNINLENKETELDGLLQNYLKFKRSRLSIIKAYNKAKEDEKNFQNKIFTYNNHKIMSNKLKILIIGHNYNIYDECIGVPIIKYLEKLGVTVLLSSNFDYKKTSILSKRLSSNLYFKYPKESIGSIEIVRDYIKGIIFLSTFPCGIDSLVNELLIRKLNIPTLNLIIDDMDGEAGIKTRLESFVDILEQV